MPARFFNHPATGKTTIALPAGGAGGGMTGAFEREVTADDFRNHPLEHQKYLDEVKADAARVAGEQT